MPHSESGATQYLIMPHTPSVTDESSTLALAVETFTRAFATRPAFAGVAPGRVNLIGEHTDYNDGFVLPIAIDRVCACVAAPSAVPASDASPSLLRISSSDALGIVEIDWNKLHQQGPAFIDSLAPPDRWAKYIIGVVELFRRHCETAANVTLPAMNIGVASSVPLGGGLSSSASLEVAVCTMLEQATGVELAPIEKARLCQRAEHEYAGVPCGIMDQYAATFGERGKALLIDCRAETHEAIPMPPTDDNGAVIVVVNSNVRHDLASGEYAKRRDACREAAAAMGFRSLRDINPLKREHLEAMSTLPDVLLAVARHVVFENGRVERFSRLAKEASAGDATWKRTLPELGNLMLRSHLLLRDDYRVSCKELDTLVDIATKIRGVYGARMTGGGFGGCIVALVRPIAVDSLLAALEKEYPERTGKLCTPFVVKAEQGAHAAKI